MRRTLGIGMLCLAVCGGMAHAQARRTIHVRVINGRNGHKVSPSILMVRIDRLGTNHSDWIRKKFDGSVDVNLPARAKVVAIQATYDNSTEVYINCDAARQRNTNALHWYKVDDILAKGLVMPNDCRRAWRATVPEVKAKPGEFVLYVRKRKWREED